MGKLGEISANLGWLPLREHDSHSGIDRIKNSFNTIPMGGCVKSCTDYPRSKVPMGEARQKQPKPGDFKISNKECRIECTHLLEWYSMNF